MTHLALKNSIRALPAAVLCTALAWSARPVLADQFYLEDPANPQTPALVEVWQEEMTVTMNPNTPQAREFQYTRYDLLDSADGRYWAYQDQAGRLCIRWPVDGQGSPLMLVGNGNWQPSSKRIVAIPTLPPPPPPTVTTQVVANTPLPPVTIELTNSHSDDVVVSVVDLRDPRGRAMEVRIPPGGSSRRQIDRDAGATQQTLLVSPQGEVLEVLEEQSIPPREIYRVVVYESHVVSTYFDATGTDATVPARFRPPAESRGLRSVGTFSIPGGENTADGAKIDVYSTAKHQRNPGAAGRYAAPHRAHRW